MSSGKISVLKCQLKEENLNKEQEEKMGLGWREGHCMQRNVCAAPEQVEAWCT